jgi:thiol-disulfide isomerase/thioredoxin
MKLAKIGLMALSVLVIGTEITHASGLEVGQNAPCVILEGQDPNGKATEGCIRDVINPTHTHTLIEFFSVDCSTCLKNLPKVSQLTKELASHATVRLVSVDRDAQRVKAFLSNSPHSQHINFPVAFDTERDAKKAYGVVSTPTIFILDRKNDVVYKHSGELSQADLNDIKQLILK